MYKDEQLKELYEESRLAAEAFAKQQELDEWDTNSLVDETRYILDGLLNSVEEKDKDDPNDRDKRRAVRWRHRPEYKYKDDLQSLLIDRRSLQSSVSRYLNAPWMHTEYLDWLCADQLTYAEFTAYLKTIYEKRRGLFATFATSVGTKKLKVASVAWQVSGKILKWGIWLVLAVIAFSMSPIVGWFWIGLTVINLAFYYKAVNYQNKQLDKMTMAYTMLRSSTISWSEFMYTLRDARELGVVWDNELYKLVETKVQG